MLLAVLTWVEGGASPESLVSLLERPKHRVEQHLVSGLLRRVQELPRRRVVVATCAGRNTSGRVCVKHILVCDDERTDAADESERAQNLLLRQQNLDDLVIGRGQTL